MAFYSARNNYVFVPVAGNGAQNIQSLLEREENGRGGAEALVGQAPDGGYLSFVARPDTLPAPPTHCFTFLCNPLVRLMRILQSHRASGFRVLPMFQGRPAGVADVIDALRTTPLAELPDGLKPQTVFVNPWREVMTHVLALEDAPKTLPRMIFRIFGPNWVTPDQVEVLNGLNVTGQAGWSDPEALRWVIDHYAADFEFIAAVGKTPLLRAA